MKKHERPDYNDNGGFELKPDDIIYVANDDLKNPVINYRVININLNMYYIELEDLQSKIRNKFTLPIVYYSKNKNKVISKQKYRIKQQIQQLEKDILTLTLELSFYKRLLREFIEENS